MQMFCPVPLPVRPSPNRIYCSFQNRFEDVPVHVFDISNGEFGLKGYLGTLAAMKDRQIRISPFLLYGIPVTPRDNPVTKHSSFFIIRLVDSTMPWYKVDLLFRDVDLYFVGFRSERVEEGTEAPPTKEDKGNEVSKKVEKKKKKEKSRKDKAKERKEMLKNEKKSGWGQWYCFSEAEFVLPEFFHARSCGIKAGYGKGMTPGGCQTFQEILLNLALFDEGKVSNGDLERSCNCVMVMLCEASRLRSVLKEMLVRMVHNLAPHELSSELDKYIHNWDQLGNMAMMARLQVAMNLDNDLDTDDVEKFPKIEGRKRHLKS